jgi:hypothetical protein
MYFVIHVEDDGVLMKSYTRGELESAMEQDPGSFAPENALRAIPDWNLSAYSEYLLIKGEIITPRVVSRIIKLEID